MADLIVFLVLLLLGFTTGTIIEKRHYASLRKREAAFVTLPTIMLKKPLQPDGITKTKLVNGSVVISIDFFKKFVAGLVNLFGGNVTAYETLVDRARREAILRMKADAGDASEIINIRIETSSISKNTQNSIGAVEVLAYGTAIYR
ncbi:YbjQ family protein [Thiomicrolovo sp. ZZH C-3]